MSVVGTTAKIIGAKDRTLLGRKGEIVLETANTILMKTPDGTITIQKTGTVLQLDDDDEPIAGEDILGRLEDRIKEGLD